MFFSIENELANFEFESARLFSAARAKILLYQLTATDKLLDEYLIANFKVNLRGACLYLLLNCKLYRDKDNTIIIKFNSTKADKLASLITYGNRELRGSNILNIAFGRTSKNNLPLKKETAKNGLRVL